MVRLERDLPPDLAGRADLSAAEYRALADAPPGRKYGNEPVEVDGHTFASRAEARRYADLRLMERAGALDQLRVQPRWVLIVNGQIIGHYTADFAYLTADGREVVEDVKGGGATKTEAYRLRKKLMLALWGIAIVEVAA
jgi:hypothetical protein